MSRSLCGSSRQKRNALSGNHNDPTFVTQDGEHCKRAEQAERIRTTSTSLAWTSPFGLDQEEYYSEFNVYTDEGHVHAITSITT
eukprot:5868242-Amphidinium_carterae.1